MRAWFALSAATFGIGFLIVFFLELAHMKWWLTRFLMPGSTLAIVSLGFAALVASRDPEWLPAAGRRLILPFVVIAATAGPAFEIAATAHRNFLLVAQKASDRLAWIARHRSYFILDTVEFDTAIVEPDPRRHFNHWRTRAPRPGAFHPPHAATRRAASRVLPDGRAAGRAEGSSHRRGGRGRRQRTQDPGATDDPSRGSPAGRRRGMGLLRLRPGAPGEGREHPRAQTSPMTFSS
jgi:hypothetical protein